MWSFGFVIYPTAWLRGGSMKNKATRILLDASWAILLWMRHSFVDRQYSPLTGMDQSECEIILE
jgi:hypothetical protein